MPTDIIACWDKVDCPGTDTPLMNLPASMLEQYDKHWYIRTAYSSPRMPLGAAWGSFGTAAVGVSDQSSNAASSTATTIAHGNSTTPPPATNSTITPEPADSDNEPPLPEQPRDPSEEIPVDYSRPQPPAHTTSAPEEAPPPFTSTPLNPQPYWYTNEEQTCQLVCPTGTIFTAVAKAGTFSSLYGVAVANALAKAYACQVAATAPMCFDDLTDKPCADVPYSGNIPVISGTPVLWIQTGGLPPGLTFADGTISGTPTVAGLYIFDVEAWDAAGNYAQHTFSLQVVAITTTSLPDGYVTDPETPYVVTLNELGGTPPLSWQLTSGALPPGLSLDEATGVISGTPPLLVDGLPNPGGTYTFTILLQDEAT